ncbi:hypothetical protein V1525DRAFT_403486 [Lipomyces kononenkoae]|uniref:Uncharacterized protein n=1 Tax=Lipomyces kononenkoae TaxID=34357 RepID=A0ACC3T0W0_LIPKO
MKFLVQLPVLMVALLLGFARGQAPVVPTTTTTTTSTSITQSPTMVWVTWTTVINGILVTTTPSVPFTQTYSSMYSSFYQPSSGSIGLGTQTGTIGVVKTPTESSSAGLQSFGRSDRPIGLVACITAAFACVILGSGSLFFM